MERGRERGLGRGRIGRALAAVSAGALGWVVLAPAGAVLEPSGHLDTSFGGDGSSFTNFAQVDTFAEARGVAIQNIGANAGRIILAGGYQDGNSEFHVALLRLNADGTQDTSFGAGGEVKTTVGANDLAYDVEIQPDDKIVVAGDSDQNFMVARYSAEGVLDTTFGGDGIVTAGVVSGQFDRAHALAIQPDGKIVVVGYGFASAATDRDMVAMRFDPNGDLDSSFGGGDGIATVSLAGTQAERLNDVAIQPDGKIVAAGEARLANGTCNTVPSPHFDSLVLRFNPDGTLDTSFGGGDGAFSVNAATVSNCPDDSFEALALQPDGKIVAAGGAATTADYATNAKQNISVARLTAAGVLDNTFDGDGLAWTNLSSTNGFTADIARDVAVLSDGAILIGAYTDAGGPSGSNQNFAALRYLADGTLDNTFDTDGKAIVDFGQNDSMDSMVADSTGRPILVGYSYPPGQFDDPLIAATRLSNGGALDTSFNGTGSFFKPLQGSSVESGGGVAVQRLGANAGKVVVAGSTDTGSGIDFGLVRYRTDGTLDDTFDSDGKATGDNGGRSDAAHGVVVDSEDRIVVAGESYGTNAPVFTLMRFNPDGGLDSTFGGGDGIAHTSVGSNSNAWNAVALAPDGKIVVAGTTSGSSADWDLAFARYNPNGTPDTSFSGDGLLTIKVGPAVEEMQAVAVAPDGKIVAGGFYFPAQTDSQFLVVRLNADGTQDTAFGGDGIVNTPIGSGTYARNEIRGLAILPDGRIVAGGKGNDGNADPQSNNVMRLVRYLPDGTLDTSFDGDGIASTNLAADRFDELSGIGLQHDEKIVAFGHSLHLYQSRDDFVVARYNWDDGSLDTTYGIADAGYTLSTLTPGTDQPAGGVVLPGGAAVAGGTVSSSDLGAARYQGDPVPVVPGAPDLEAASDTGLSAADDITNDPTPTLVGLAPGCNVGETTVLEIDGAVTTPLTRQLCRTGAWSVPTAALADGVHTFAAFSRNGFGDSAETAALSITVDTVAQAPTIATPADGSDVGLPPSPTISGTITETVAGSTVKVMEVTTELCSVTVDASGSWSCTPTLGEGAHTITAVLSDVAGNTSPASAPVDFTISKGETLTAVVSSLNPSTYGDDVTVTVSVTSVAGSQPAPTGSVQLAVGGGSPQTLSLEDGAATLDLGDLGTGAHTVTASYGGDQYYAGSTASLTQTVERAGAAVKLTSSPNPSGPGEAVTFTATVEPSSSGRPAPPTGSVEFAIDGAAPVKVDMHSPAVYTTASLPAGTHTVTATYTGDTHYLPASVTLSGGHVVNGPAGGGGGTGGIDPGVDGAGPGGTVVGDPGTGGTGTSGTGGTGGTGGGGTDVEGTGAGGTPGTRGTLPRTGGGPGPLLPAAVGLVLLGLVTLAARRVT